MIPSMRVLKVYHIGETADENLEITLSPGLIKLVATKDGIVQNRPIKKTTIFFVDDPEIMEFNLSPLDSLTIEQVVGAYSFGEEF